MDSPLLLECGRSESPWPALEEKLSPVPSPQSEKKTPSSPFLPPNIAAVHLEASPSPLTSPKAVHHAATPGPSGLAAPIPTRASTSWLNLASSSIDDDDDEEAWDPRPLSPPPPGSSPIPRGTPPPPFGPRRCIPRSELRWIHAGVCKDIRSHIHDIWYAFRELKHGGYKIIYASDNSGTPLGNHDVGQIKRNLITWDEHHEAAWNHFYSGWGNWRNRKATEGRKCQRDYLLESYLDPNFHDPFPRGTNKRSIAPPLNVIHREDENSSTVIRIRSSAASSQNQERCYPSTNIPMTLDGIKTGAYKNDDPSAITVIATFLTGGLVFNGRYADAARDRVDSIESAFFEMGWRVDRNAIFEVNNDFRDKRVRNALESLAWVGAPPLKVDQHKGNEVEELIADFASNDDSDSEDMDPNDEGNRNDDVDDGGDLPVRGSNEEGEGVADVDGDLFMSDDDDILSTHASNTLDEYPVSRMEDVDDEDIQLMMGIYPEIKESEATELGSIVSPRRERSDLDNEDEEMDEHPARSTRRERSHSAFILDREDEDKELGANTPRSSAISD